MSGHTPAPWHSYPMPTKTHAEAAANRRVAIAAADLLEALEEIIARNEIQHWFNLDQARAAVAKATGTKP